MQCCGTTGASCTGQPPTIPDNRDVCGTPGSPETRRPKPVSTTALEVACGPRLQHSVGPEHLVEDLANDRLLAQVVVHHRFTSCRRHVGGGSLRVRVTSTDIWMCAQPVAEHRVTDRLWAARAPHMHI